jgi:hypothetical protein
MLAVLRAMLRGPSFDPRRARRIGRSVCAAQNVEPGSAEEVEGGAGVLPCTGIADGSATLGPVVGVEVVEAPGEVGEDGRSALAAALFSGVLSVTSGAFFVAVRAGVRSFALSAASFAREK